MHKIDILMATYNGAPYIQEQIDSILTQTYVNWRLWTRDDGSSDNTTGIIESYANIDGRIQIIRDHLSCGSPQANFLELLKHSTADFVCFCDQDDIWIPSKLQDMLDFIEKKDNTQPQVVFSDGYLYYGQKSDKSDRLLNARPHNLKETLFCNGGIHGSMSMFNAAMRNKMLDPIAYVAMHDHLLTLLGCAFNGIDYLEKPTFYYRQHQHNVTPYISTNIFQRIVRTLTENKNLPVIDKKHYKGIEAFFRIHAKELSRQDQQLCELYLQYPQYNSATRFFSILYNGFSLNNSKINLIAKLLVKKYSDFYET